MTTLEQRLDNAFKQLRRQGIVAKRNVSACCQSCANLNLADEVPVIWSFGGEGNRNVISGDYYYYSEWMFNHDNLTEDGGELNDSGKRVLATLAQNGIVVEWEEEDTTRRPFRKLTLNLEKSLANATI